MRYGIFVFIILLVFFIAGCSGKTNPTTPYGNAIPDISKLTSSNLPIGVSDWFDNGSPAAGVGVLGLFSLQIDKENVSAELTSLRESSLTDALEIVDITNFLTLVPCTDCIHLNRISVTPEGYVVLNIGIRHPFPAGDPYKPITGRNRGDLHVFNVEGQVISNRSIISFPGLAGSVADFKLVNADGYSSYLDQSLETIYPTEATLHPYILHFDDYTAGNFDLSNPMGFESVTNPPPSGNLVMAMGCDYDDQDYIFDFDGRVEFIYAVGCTYAVSAASMSTRFSPEYRVPQHNKKAASEVKVEILSNSLEENDDTSSATLQIQVLDMNHGVSTGSALNEMLSDSSVGSISIEVPGVTLTPVIDASPIATGGDGRDPSNPLKYEITFTNNALAAQGTYPGLVKVFDTYAPGQNSSPLLEGKDGIKRVDPTVNPLTGKFVIDEFATYAVFSIDVAENIEPQPPVAVISEPCDDNLIMIGSSLFFDGRLSYDDDPPIVNYAWDFRWDGDPSNFDVDSTLDHLNWKFNNPSTNTVGLRVQDSDGLFGYDSVTVVAIVEILPPRWHQELLVSGWTDGAETTERDSNPCKQVVADCNGMVHIIFKFRSNGGPTSGLYYVNSDGFTASTPEYLDGTTDSLYQPTLRIDTDDNLHLVYVFNNAIKYLKRESGTWSTPETVITTADTPGYGIEFPSMDINYLGDIMITFAKVTGGMDWFLAYVFNDGSGWSSHQNITPFYSSPYTTSQMVNAGPDGLFHLLYKGHPDSASSSLHLFHAIYKNGSWNTPFRFNTDTGLNLALSGYVASDGDVFAVWQTDRFGLNDVMYQRYDAVTEIWGQPIRVSQNPISGDYSLIPDLGVDANGSVMYVWEYYDGTWRHLYYKQFNETADPTTIINMPERDIITGTWNRSNPNLYFERNGHVHCLFESDRPSPGNYYSRDMYYIEWW